MNLRLAAAAVALSALAGVISAMSGSTHWQDSGSVHAYAGPVLGEPPTAFLEWKRIDSPSLVSGHVDPDAALTNSLTMFDDTDDGERNVPKNKALRSSDASISCEAQGMPRAINDFTAKIVVRNHTVEKIEDLFVKVAFTREITGWKHQHIFGRFTLNENETMTIENEDILRFQSPLPGDGYAIECELRQHRTGPFIFGRPDVSLSADSDRFSLAHYQSQSNEKSVADLTSCSAQARDLQVGEKVKLTVRAKKKKNVGPEVMAIGFIEIFRGDNFVISYPPPKSGLFGLVNKRVEMQKLVAFLTNNNNIDRTFLFSHDFEFSRSGLYTAYCFLNTGSVPSSSNTIDGKSTGDDISIDEFRQAYALTAAALINASSAQGLAHHTVLSVFRALKLFSHFESVRAVHFCVGDPEKDCKFYSTPGEPDLEIGSLRTSKSKVEPGEPFTLTANVHNIGNGPSSETRIYLYRSTWPANGEEGDQFVEYKLTGLPSAGTEIVLQSFAAPESTGVHGYIACIIPASGESNTINNCSDEVWITVEEADRGRPDLVVNNPGATKSAVGPGESFDMNATVLNRGDGRSSKTELRYYQSTDSAISTNDTQVGPTDEVVEALDPLGTDRESARLTAPEDAGDYYYGACVVPLPVESDANNNCSASVQVTVNAAESGRPDLVVESPSVSDSQLETGEYFRLSATVRNSGDGPSVATPLHYFRSTDSTISIDDTKVETDKVSALDPSETDDESERLIATGAGNYYYGACAVSLLDESNINNNCSSGVAVTVGADSQDSPDLVVYSPSVYEKLFDPGERFNMAFWVRNEGDGPSSATANLKYYRSSDSTISSSDTELTVQSGISQVGPISATGRGTVSVYLNAHSSGTYYYGACVGTVPGESNTHNNCAAVFRVTLAAPDLVVQSPSVNSSSAEPGGTFTLSVTVHNQGDSRSASTTLRYYRSNDSTITSNDTQVGADNASSLKPNKSSRESIILSAPSSAGTYYYGACVDSISGESDTQNNCSSSVAVTVTGVSQTPPDLVVQSPSVNDSSVEPGDSFTLSATVLNQGVGASASTTLRYYRSTDATVSISDTSLGTDSVSSLDPNGTSSHSVSLTAPSNIGTYYYGACVDPVVGESSTLNNCSSSVSVTVATTSSGSPDLRAQAPSVSENIVRVGGSFTLRATVSNQGNRGGGTSASSTLRYYRSTDSTISTIDTEVGMDAVGGLGFGQISSMSIDLTAPAVAGIYYYGACVDSVSGEPNTQNNCTAGVEVTVEDSFPDLVVESPSVSDSNLETGESFTLRATVRNQGDGTSSSTTLRYYRSTDSTISISDAFVDTDGVPSLGSGETSPESDGVTAPTSAGTYYYGACVDFVSGESNTENNCSAGVEVTVTGESRASPDLVVQSPSVSDTSVKAGGTLTLSVTVRNQGDGASATTTLRYYRSTNSRIITSDTLEGTETVSVLSPSQTSSRSIDLTAPTRPDTYYYGACVESVSGESDTQNNCSAGVKVIVEEVFPDLVVDTPTVSDSNLETGESFRLNATVRNQGDGRPNSATTLRYYLSTDSSISTSDTEVGTDDVGRVRPSEADAESIDLTAPTSAGTYYYGACVDSVAYESNTQNNCSAGVSVTVTQGNPDLVVESPAVTVSNPAAGTVFNLSATVRNQGDHTSAATTLRYYLSTDSTISTSDTEVGTDAVSSLGPSGTDSETIGLTAPVNAGTYYYGACVDFVSDESNTQNNCSGSIQVTVTGTTETSPDLVLESPSVTDSHIEPEDRIRVGVTVRNQGDGSSSATTTRFYLSTDATISTSDTEVGTDPTGILDPNETDDESDRFDAPSTVGTYYYGACIDSVSGESDTQNNCSASVKVIVSEVGVGNPDLVVESPSVSSNNLEAGASFTLSATVRNQGTGRSPSTTLRYYRSTDTTISTGDTQVETDGVASLGPTETGGESEQLLAPGDAGTYYYGACVESVARESNTQNNCSAGAAVVVTGSATVGPDLVVESPSVDESSLGPDESFSLSLTVRNQGNARSNRTTLRYYRSTDSTISTSDTEIDTDSVSRLDPAETNDENESLRTPDAAGTYYYGACVDPVTDESNTNNNCSSGVEVTVSANSGSLFSLMSLSSPVIPYGGARQSLVASADDADTSLSN